MPADIRSIDFDEADIGCWTDFNRNDEICPGYIFTAWGVANYAAAHGIKPVSLFEPNLLLLCPRGGDYELYIISYEDLSGKSKDMHNPVPAVSDENLKDEIIITDMVSGCDIPAIKLKDVPNKDMFLLANYVDTGKF